MNNGRVWKWRYLVVLLVVCGSVLCSAQLSGYSYARAITIDHRQVANSDQTDFPVLISGTFPFLATVANGGKVRNSNGYDIVLTSDAAGQNRLDHEIDSYNAQSGTVSFWVRVPLVSHTSDTTLYIWYGNSAITTSQENKTGVWRNGYIGVWHFGSNGTLSTTDSTGNCGTGANYNGSATSGPVAGGLTLSGNGSINLGTVAALNTTNPVTFSAWAKTNEVGNDLIIGGYQNSGSDPGYAFGIGMTGQGRLSYWSGAGGQWVGSTGIVNNNSYHLVSVTVSGSTAAFYIDGLPSGTATSAQPNSYSGNRRIGSTSDATWANYNGSLDEVRISSVARSSDWQATEYNNQSAPTTFAIMSNTEAAGTLPSSSPLILSPTSMTYSRAITIDHRQVVNTDQTDFPVLISGVFPFLASTANGGHVQSTSGYDIEFTSDSAGQNQLNHEIDTYDPVTGTAAFWVRIPTLSHSTDTPIYIWYGNSSALASQENKGGVWRNGYILVQHYGSPTSLNLLDSSSNHNNAYNIGISAGSGKIGGAGSFPNLSYDMLRVGTSASLRPSSAITLEAWANPVNNGADSWGNIISLGYRTDTSWSAPYTVWNLGLNAGSPILSFGVTTAAVSHVASTSPVLAYNQWSHTAATYDGSTLRVFLNGQQSGTATGVTGPIDYGSSGDVAIGLRSPYSKDNQWNGKLDEVRISNIARSSDWIATGYANQNSPGTFLFVSPTEATAGNASPYPLRYPPTTFDYERTININHQQVPNTDQTDFPVLISGTFSFLATTSNGGKVQNPNGFDIVFTSDSGGQNQLDHEVDSYNPITGAAAFWVRVPALSHTTDTPIYMWYGNSSVVVSQENRPGVWRNNYVAVLHFGNGSSLNTFDSSGNGNNAISNGVTSVSGQVNGAANFSTDSSLFTIPTIALSNLSYTVGAWVSFPLKTNSSGWSTLFRGGTNDHPILIQQSNWHLGVYDNAGSTGFHDSGFAVNTLSTGWHYVVAVGSASTSAFFVDGSLVGTTNFKSNAQITYIGNCGVCTGQEIGTVDEVRIATSTSRSADWIAAEYNNQNSPSTFAVVASTDVTVASLPTIAGITPSQGPVGTQIVISGSNFSSTQGSSFVTVNGLQCSVASWSDTQIVAVIPLNATTGPVAVFASGMWSNGVPFTVLQDTPPNVSITSPAQGSTLVKGAISLAATATDADGTISKVAFYDGSTELVEITTPPYVYTWFPSTTGFHTLTATTTDNSGVTTTSSPVTIAVVVVGNWFDQDIGAVSQAGSASYANGTFTVQASGSFGGTVDAFHFVYQALTGDGTIVARFVSSTGGNAGVMMRETLDPASTAYFQSFSSYYNGYSQGNQTWYRTSTGASSGWVGIPATVPYWMKVVRSGSTFNGYYSSDGVNWVQFGSQTIGMAQTIYVGLAVAGGTAVFDHVSLDSVTAPAPAITGISATTGTVGEQVTIYGQHFGASQGSSLLLLNGSSVTVNSWSDTTIVFTVPVGATSGNLVVTVAPSMNNSNPVEFAVTSQPLPTGWLDRDIGSVSQAGTATYSNGGFSIQGYGKGFGDPVDAFHFVYQPLTGDGTIVARIVTATGEYTGVMMRETMDAGSRAVFEGYSGYWNNYSSGKQFWYRSVSNTAPSYWGLSTTLPYWVKLVRSGSTFSGYYSSDGVNWVAQDSTTIGMAATIYVGLVGTNNVAAFDNVCLDSTAAPAPAITVVSVTTASVGQQVTVTGEHFGASQGASTVLLNGSPVTVNTWSDNSIEITIPAGATSGYLVVSVAPAMNNSNPIDFTITSQPLPNGWLDQDVGTVTQPGSATYTTGGFSVQAYGKFNGTNDAIHFVYKTLTGDGSIVARVASTNYPNGSYAGLMMRETLDDSSPMVFVGYSTYWNAYNSAIQSVYRTDEGASSVATGASAGVQTWLKVVRSGTNLMSYFSADGSSWTLMAGPISISLPDTIYVGIAVANGGVLMDNVSLTSTANPVPVINSLSATTGPIGSQVTITGSNFGATQGGSTVLLNDAPLTVNSWSDSSISVTIPANATSGYVVVTLAPSMNTSNALVFTITSQPLPSGWYDRDIGLVAQAGASSYANSVFTINGSGNLGGTADAYHFVYQPLTTDGTLTARVVTGNAGIMMRETLDAASSYIFVGFYGSSILIHRDAPGFPATQTGGPGNSKPYYVKIVRAANSFTGYASPDGITWTQIGSPVVITTAQTVYAGLAITGAPNSSGTFDNVAISSGASLPDPVVTTMTPLAGPPGTLVTISGSGFGANQGGSTVQFNNTSAAVSSWSDSQIVVAVPQDATTGPVSVNVGNITAQGPYFTVQFTAQVTDSFGNVSNYTSKPAGGFWMMTNADGSGCSSCTSRGVHQNAFDGQGNIAWTSDELGHSTTYHYDSSNNLLSESARLDSSNVATTSYTYNSFGEVLTATDPLGNVTTNAYDANGNLTSVTTPKPNSSTAASVTQFAYDTKGELTQITDPLNHVTHIAYNPVGLIQSITDANNKTTSYEYDSHGNRTAVVDALNNRTTFAYDSGDRLTLITYPDQTTTGFGYDYRGRRTSVTDPNGKTTTYAYDDADRLISVTDAAQNVTQYGYDTENNLTSITDALNRVTSFQYDEFGRVKETDFPSSYNETYAYDAASNLTSKTDRKGQTIQYVYDALDRLTRKMYQDSSEVDYLYDLVGKIKQVTDPTGTYSFAYDNMGRLIGTTTQYSFLPTRTLTNGYTYDAASNRTGYTDPESGTVTYGYDALNRLTNLNSSLAGNFGFGYDDLSRRTSLTRPNGVTTNYGYDNLSRLLSVLHQAGGTTTIDGASYTYDNAGNRTSKTNYLNSAVENYAYDAIYQLKQVTQGANTTESYTYDKVGNRQSSLNVASYSYNSSNELTSADATSFTYDQNGNTLTKNDTNGQTTYAWDFENRLTSVTLPSGGGVVTFKYDPFGRRIERSGPSGTTIYAYDGANGIEELSTSGAATARYVQGAGIDEPLAQSSTGLNYYSADGLGSITSMEDASGTPQATFVYGAFGVLSSSTGSVNNSYRYTGREFDQDTGLYYYRARYYDSQIGRFLSEDPLEFDTGANFYAYVNNNPTVLVDPTGMEPSWWQQLKDWFNQHTNGNATSSAKSCCDSDGMRDATPRESALILAKAKSFAGVHYYSGGGGKSSVENGMDCSGMVFCAINAAGFPYSYVNTGHISGNPRFRPLGSSPLQAGDIALFPGHVGFYDPSPEKPGETIWSARSGKGIVTSGKPSWFGTPKYFRIRMKCK